MNAQQIIKMIKVHSGIPSGIRMIRQKRKKKENERLRIVFLCQLPQLWGCMESIYESAEEDKEVDAYILAVPDEWDTEEKARITYDYMKECGYKVINGYDAEKKEFFDLKTLNPDYVFLPRPYDNYLPLQYQSEQLSKYTKVCHVCYGYTCEGDYILKTAFSKYFITNCYMVFAENDSVQKYCRKCLPISTRLGLRKIPKTPFPRFDLMKKFEGTEGPSWKLKREETEKRIIWTPRWTLEEKLGGTSFFAFKEFFFEYAKQHPKDEILVRPHPLAFGNFVKVGAMTEQEVEQYKKTCQEAVNLQLDTEKEYLGSFASADILVSDMSGVVVDFAVTGKPVIFCNDKEIFNESNKELLKAYYIVHDEKELSQTLEMLRNGQDVKKEYRQQVVKKILGECDGQNGKRIMEYIKKDYLE